MKKTVLVTGGAGYIGSHVVNVLLKDDCKVEVVDSFRESTNNMIKHELVTYHKVDIRNIKELLVIFKNTKPDIVFHFAALASVPDSVERPADYYSTNIIGGFNLLECMREVGCTKIIFSSSASTYGEPQSEIITEDHQQIPTNPYGYTKLVFENMLKDYHKAYNLSSISLRYFCASGADYMSGLGEYHLPETHVIPSIIETILGIREQFFVFGGDYPTLDGTGIRDYIHVNDLADAHVQALKKIFENKPFCLFYNLGINKGFSVKELILAAEDVSGTKLKYSIKPRREGDPSRLIADSTKAQQELDWKPHI